MEVDSESICFTIYIQVNQFKVVLMNSFIFHQQKNFFFNLLSHNENKQKFSLTLCLVALQNEMDFLLKCWVNVPVFILELFSSTKEILSQFCCTSLSSSKMCESIFQWLHYENLGQATYQKNFKFTITLSTI